MLESAFSGHPMNESTQTHTLYRQAYALRLFTHSLPYEETQISKDKKQHLITVSIPSECGNRVSEHVANTRQINASLSITYNASRSACTGRVIFFLSLESLYTTSRRWLRIGHGLRCQCSGIPYDGASCCSSKCTAITTISRISMSRGWHTSFAAIVLITLVQHNGS